MQRLLFTVIACYCLAGVAAAETPQGAQPELGRGWQWVTLGSNVTQVTTGGRFTGDHWYGGLNIGGYSAAQGFETNFFVGGDAGYRLALHNRWHLRTEFGYRHLMPDGSDDPTVLLDHHFTLSLQLLLEVSLNEHLGLFLGTGIDRLYSGYSLGSPHKNRGVVSWGVSLL